MEQLGRMLRDVSHPITDKSWFLDPDYWMGNLVARLVLIFVLPMISISTQFWKSSALRHTLGYSKWVNVFGILSCLMKIAYWVKHPYDDALFFQSCFLIFGHLMLTFQHMLVEREKYGEMFWERNFVDFEFADFWDWTNVISYIECTTYTLIVLTVTVCILSPVSEFMMLFGLVNLLIETCIMIPQAVRNTLNETTHGLSKSTVALWTIGDIYKYSYYLTHAVPTMFRISSIIQVIVDFILLAQIFQYGDAPRPGIQN